MKPEPSTPTQPDRTKHILPSLGVLADISAVGGLLSGGAKLLVLVLGLAAMIMGSAAIFRDRGNKIPTSTFVFTLCIALGGAGIVGAVIDRNLYPSAASSPNSRVKSPGPHGATNDPDGTIPPANTIPSDSPPSLPATSVPSSPRSPQLLPAYSSRSMTIHVSDCNGRTPVNMNIPRIRPEKIYDVDFYFTNCYTKSRKPSIEIQGTTSVAVLRTSTATAESCKSALDTSSLQSNAEVTPEVGLILCFRRTSEGVDYAGGTQQINSLQITEVESDHFIATATGWKIS